MRALKWFLTTSIVIALMVAGMEYGVDGARYVALFWLWTISIMGTLIALSEHLRDAVMAEYKGPVVPKPVVMVVDIFTLGFVVWHGYFVLGAFFIVSIVGCSGVVKQWKAAHKPEAQEAASGAQA